MPRWPERCCRWTLGRYRTMFRCRGTVVPWASLGLRLERRRCLRDTFQESAFSARSCCARSLWFVFAEFLKKEKYTNTRILYRASVGFREVRTSTLLLKEMKTWLKEDYFRLSLRWKVFSVNVFRSQLHISCITTHIWLSSSSLSRSDRETERQRQRDRDTKVPSDLE